MAQLAANEIFVGVIGIVEIASNNGFKLCKKLMKHVPLLDRLNEDLSSEFFRRHAGDKGTQSHAGFCIKVLYCTSTPQSVLYSTVLYCSRRTNRDSCRTLRECTVLQRRAPNPSVKQYFVENSLTILTGARTMATKVQYLRVQ